MSAQPQLVIVTGSGRSGTSSVAGTLKRLGLHIPQPEVPADDRNPLGYYETAWVAEFHKVWLDDVPVRTIDARPDAGGIAMGTVTPEREAELLEWLRAELAAQPAGTVTAIKETRAYWVYPLWQRVAADAGARLTSLTMLRHPVQVVRSRDSAYLTGESDRFRRQRETTNVAAWMNSVFETERATRGNPRAFVPYYDLIGDWRAAMTRACGQLEVPLGDLAAPHPVDDFITTSLNRSAADWDGLMVAPSLVDLAERTWATAGVLVEQPRDPAAQAALDALREEYVEVYETAAAIALDETVAQVRGVRNTLQQRLANKQARLDRKNQTIEQLRAEIAELRKSRAPRVLRRGSRSRTTP